MTNRTHALYRFYDATGQLLYVGITLDPGSRWRSHAQDKPWWLEVTRIELEPFPDRHSVLEAERNAIIAEKPRYNIVHNRGSKTTPAPGFTASWDEWFATEWGKTAADMPDDCHEICAPRGYLNIYYPHFWHDGTAHYTCARGHSWTCGWGHKHIGAAPQNRGTRQMPEVVVPSMGSDR